MTEKQDLAMADAPLTRREFVKTAAAGVLAVGGAPLLSGCTSAAPVRISNSGGGKTRFALVGVGGRSKMYRDAIEGPYRQWHELVAYCDNNQGRLRLAQQRSETATGRKPPIFDAAEDPEAFERMIARTRPDVVIVTTRDCFHDDYVCRALRLGCDAITEKPMTTDEHKCQRMIDTVRETGRRCRVTFNCRYMPSAAQVKDVLMSGRIGDVLSVDFHWMLDTTHGADYFRRWHGNKVNSGGLMIHKASHHFDLMNWWLSAIPTHVFATGKREFYTPAMSRRMGLNGPHERCLACPEKQECGFALDLKANAELKRLYLDNEQYDGYFRDRCIFRPDIDIEDTMNVLARYDNGVTMTYSLNAFAAWEGYTVIFNGTKGRLEYKCEQSVSVFGDGSVPSALKPEGTTIRIYPIRQPAYALEVWKGEGGHGGGDRVMLDDIFLPRPPKDKYLRNADQRSGAFSMLIGAAANLSFKTGRQIEIAELVQGIGAPDYPPMPTHRAPVPMPRIPTRKVPSTPKAPPRQNS